MKKILLLTSVFALLTSCGVTTKTARTETASVEVLNTTIADLDVSQKRITYTLEPTSDIKAAGLENVKNAAIQEALEQNGNADVLLEPQFVVRQKKTLFGLKVISVTVSGRPAKYINFRSPADSLIVK